MEPPVRMEALEFEKAVDGEVGQLDVARQRLAAGRKRIEELRVLLAGLAEQAADALNVLDAVEFDPALHETEVSRVHRLVAAVMEVINLPVFVPGSGELTEASAEVLRKHAGSPV